MTQADANTLFQIAYTLDSYKRIKLRAADGSKQLYIVVRDQLATKIAEDLRELAARGEHTDVRSLNGGRKKN